MIVPRTSFLVSSETELTGPDVTHGEAVTMSVQSSKMSVHGGKRKIATRRAPDPHREVILVWRVRLTRPPHTCPPILNSEREECNASERASAMCVKANLREIVNDSFFFDIHQVRRCAAAADFACGKPEISHDGRCQHAGRINR